MNPPPHLPPMIRTDKTNWFGHSKGDANYRRMVGDVIWPADTPFADVVGYFPAPILAIRVLKSQPPHS